MGNCLVTQLKGVVDNDNLSEFGYLDITVTPFETLPVSSSNTIGLNFNEEGTIKATSGGYIIVNEEHVTSVSVPANVTSPYSFAYNAEYKIRIPKYSIIELASGIQTPFGINLSDLKYATSLNKLIFRGENGYSIGDISNLENLPLIELNLSNQNWNGKITGDIAKLPSTLTKIHLGTNKGIYGNIKDLKSIVLTNVQLYYTVVEGSLEEFAAAQVSATRSSGTCVINPNSIITYNGVALVEGVSKTIKFGTSMVNPTPEETAQGYQIS